MKNFLIAAALVVSSVAAHAQDARVQSLIGKISKLDGKSGVATSTIERDGTGRCTLRVETDESGTSIFFDDTGHYFTPVAHIFNDAEAVSETTVLVSTSSDRPGGDACGTAGGAVRYKKTVSLVGKTLKIEETFRCSLELFKKYELTATCKLN